MRWLYFISDNCVYSFLHSNCTISNITGKYRNIFANYRSLSSKHHPRFHPYSKSTLTLRAPFSFPNRFATCNFSSPHNSSFTDHSSTTSHQPHSPRARSRFVSFLYFFFFSFSTPRFKSYIIHPSDVRFFSLSLFPSNTFTKIHKKLGGSVQPQVIRFPRNEIDRLRRVNKTSVLDLSPLLLKSKNWIDENWVKRRSIIKERKNHWISFGITCQERSIKLSHHQLSGRRKKKRRENRKENEIQTKREKERRAFLRKME